MTPGQNEGELPRRRRVDGGAADETLPRGFGPSYRLVEALETAAGETRRRYFGLRVAPAGPAEGHPSATVYETEVLIEVQGASAQEERVGELARAWLAPGEGEARPRALAAACDVGIVEGSVYAAFTGVAGRSLRAILDRARDRAVPLPVSMVALLAREMLDGLASLMAVGLSAELQAERVFVSYAGAVKLLPTTPRAESATADSDPLGARLIWELLTGRPAPLEVAGKALPPPSRFDRALGLAVDAVMARAEGPGRAFAQPRDFAAELAGVLPVPAARAELGLFVQALFAEDAAAELQRRRRRPSVAPGTPAPVVHVTPPLGARVVAEAAADGDASALVGTTVAGRYAIKRVLGQGAMATVYEALHVGIGKRVAIKVPRAASADSEMRARFRVEIDAVARIGHANVVDITDAGTLDNGRSFFVMEFLDGEDLETLVARQGPLPLARALRIAVQICRAADAAHGAGIVHRDLKPSNVMLIRDAEAAERPAGEPPEAAEQVKVLDFGIAKLTRAAGSRSGSEGAPGALRESPTQPRGLVGTPRYMAPEQLDAEAPVGPRADVYAIGGVLYFLLTAEPPFPDAEPETVCRRKLHEDAPLVRARRPDVPLEVELAIEAALAREPSRRPASARAFGQRLASLLPDTAALAAAPRPRRTSTTVVIRGARRRHLLWAGGGALALAVAAVLLWPSRRVPPPAPVLAVAPPRPVPKPVPPPVEVVPPPTAPPVVSAPRPAPPRVAHGRAVRRDPVPAAAPLSKPNVDVGAVLARGEEAFVLGEFVEAVMLARKAALGGGGARARVLEGRALLRLGEPEEAETAFVAALALQPDSAAALRGRSEAQAARARR